MPNHPSTNGKPEPLTVERIDGRYPFPNGATEPAIFRRDQIETTVQPREDGTATIRISDRNYPDMWIELTLRGTIADLLLTQESEEQEG